MQFCEICNRNMPEDESPICKPCLNAESIILHGMDVNGNGRAITAQDKVKMLIDFNWCGPYQL